MHTSSADTDLIVQVRTGGDIVMFQCQSIRNCQFGTFDQMSVIPVTLVMGRIGQN